MLAYCQKVRHPILWVEMRLGKTIVMIRYARQIGARRILVVAPGSALTSWENELILEGEPLYTLLMGTRAVRRKKLLEAGKWALINREGFRSLPEIKNIQWDLVILDESASMIRYPGTKITKFFLKNFKDIDHRAVLAGRPDPQNRLLDYWTQMAFAEGGGWSGFTNYWHFRHTLFYPAGFEWKPKPGIREKIISTISKTAFVLNRADVDLDTPKVFERRSFDLPPKLKKLYKEAEEKLVLLDKKTIWTIVAYQWLRQMAGGFVGGELIWDGKIKELVRLLTGELSDEQVVIWFSYNQELKASFEALQSYCSTTHLTGATPEAERKRRLQLFQVGDVRVLLVQVRVAETGMDLSAADTCIYYSPPWSGLAWQQSQDRILGKLDKDGVLIMSLLTKGTVDYSAQYALKHADQSGRSFLAEVQEEIGRRHAAGRKVTVH